MSLVDCPAGSGKLRAPRESGQQLVVPDRTSLADAIDGNRSRRRASQLDIGGLPLAALAAEARSDLRSAAIAYTTAYRDIPERWLEPGDTPLILSGHQPELFHPGVWFKNFLLDDIARHHAATAVNLIIDNDLCTSARIAVPTGNPESPERTTVAYDVDQVAVPHEQRALGSRDVFAAFPRQIQQVIGELVATPLVHELWPLMYQATNRQVRLGNVLAEGRHRFEAALGLESLELPWSRVCDARSFRRFLIHLLRNMPNFHRLYNEAVVDYRRRHRLRSQSHPVPLLRRDGSWWETPLWIWSEAAPQRQALWVSFDSACWKLRGEFAVPLVSDPSVVTVEDGDADQLMDQLGVLRQRGIKIRTRALITTMYARSILSDLFIHGIGGAAYDEVTDVLIAQFLGLERPAFVTATATLHLPVARPAVDHDDLRQVVGMLRDMWYHPERHIERLEIPAADLRSLQPLMDEKRAWIDGFACPPGDDSSGTSFGRQRHQALERINGALRETLQSHRRQLLAQREALERRLRARNLLASREYSYCLFPRESLESLRMGR